MIQAFYQTLQIWESISEIQSIKGISFDWLTDDRCVPATNCALTVKLVLCL